MKPTKNLVYCLSCRHNKMLFDSQKKADRFIVFNGDEILEDTGKAPVRSYYCRLCCGWHVTSNTSEADAQLFDERDQARVSRIDVALRDKEKAKEVKEAGAEAIDKRFDEIGQLLLDLEIYKADKKLRETMYGLYVARRYYPRWRSVQRLIQKGQGLQRIVRIINAPESSTDQIVDTLERITGPDGTVLTSELVPSIQWFVRFSKYLNSLKEQIVQGDAVDVLCELVILQDEILAIDGYKSKAVRKNLSNLHRSLMMRVLDTLENGTPSEKAVEECIRAIEILDDQAQAALQQGDSKRCRACIRDAFTILYHIKVPQVADSIRERLSYLNCYCLTLNTSTMNINLIKEITKEEFEQDAAQLKEAVKLEKCKRVTELYPEMTIRKAFELWSLAQVPLRRGFFDEFAYQYDLDSPEDFNRWYGQKGHSFDLDYASIMLFPEYVTLEDGTKGWIFRLMGNPGNPVMLAHYCLKLQKAGVLFYLRDPQYVMKGLGYWIRSRRYEFKKKGSLLPLAERESEQIASSE